MKKRVVHSRYHSGDVSCMRTKCGRYIKDVLSTNFHWEITCKSCLKAELAQIRSNIKYLKQKEEELLERIDK
jgi:hypothetical protein